MDNLLLSGRPGIGKTTVVRRLVSRISVPAGGFYSDEIRSRAGRIGFRVVDLEGPTGLLAHIDRRRIQTVGSSPPPRVGKYYVDVPGFESIGVRALRTALSTKDLIVVDEIGRMELYSRRFRAEVLAALDSPKPLVAVIQQRSDPFLDSIRVRPDVRLWTVTPTNRDRLPGELAALLSSSSDL